MNDNQSPAFQAALTVIASAPHLRLVWSARLHPITGDLLPWERLHDLLLFNSFIGWLRQEARNKP